MDEQINVGAVGRIAGANDLQRSIDQLNREIGMLRQSNQNVASAFTSGFRTGSRPPSFGETLGSLSRASGTMSSGKTNGGVAPPSGSQTILNWGTPGGGGAAPPAGQGSPAAPMGSGKGNGGVITRMAHNPAAVKAAAVTGIGVGVANGLLTSNADQLMGLDSAFRFSQIGTSGSYREAYDRTWGQYTQGATDRAQVMMLMNKTGMAPGAAGSRFLARNMASMAMANPQASGAQNMQTMSQFWTPQASNNLRMLGVNTIGVGGQKADPLDIANQVLKMANGDAIKTQEQIQAALDPNSNLMASLQIWEAQGVITPDMRGTVVNNIRNILNARVGGMSYERLRSLKNQASGRGSQAKVAQKQIAAVGAGFDSALERTRGQNAVQGQAAVNELDGFAEAVHRSTDVMIEFYEGLNQMLHQSGFSHLRGYRTGTQGKALLFSGLPGVNSSEGSILGGAVPPGYADGGVLPGYSPGRDIHRFVSRTGGILDLGGGEGILVPEATTALGGEAGIKEINDKAKRGALKRQAFKEGGVVQVDGEPMSALAAKQLALAEKLSGTPMRVMQGSYQPKTSYSGTSHMGGGVADTSPGSFNAQFWLRRVGFAAWARNIPGAAYAGSGAHVHSVSLLDPTAKGHAQLSSWARGEDGLGHSDYGPRPAMLPNLAKLLGDPNLDVPGGVGNGGDGGKKKGGSTMSDPTESAVGAGASLGGTPTSGGGLLTSELQVLQMAFARAGGGAYSSGSAAASVEGETPDEGHGPGGGSGGGPGNGSTPPGGGGGSGGNPAANKRLARVMMKAFGWGEDQWPALEALWQGESSWNHQADNPSSSAYGIPQALIDLDGRVMPKGYYDSREGHGANANFKGGDPQVQILWGLNYIKGSYGSPANAYSKWKGRSPHWYDKGSWKLPEDQDAVVHQGEMIIPETFAETLRREISGKEGNPYGSSAGSKKGDNCVHLEFNEKSIVMHVGLGATEANGRAAARGFVEELQHHETVKKIRRGVA